MPKLSQKRISSNLSQNGFPKPKKVECFQCKKEFCIKFVVPHKDYSQKNSWFYWTGTKGNQQICDPCLRKFYYNKPLYWETITDLKKRQQIRKYIYDGTIA